MLFFKTSMRIIGVSTKSDPRQKCLRTQSLSITAVSDVLPTDYTEKSILFSWQCPVILLIHVRHLIKASVMFVFASTQGHFGKTI